MLTQEKIKEFYKEREKINGLDGWYSRMFSQYVEFLKKVLAGESPAIIAEHYVVMSRKEFERITANRAVYSEKP